MRRINSQFQFLVRNVNTRQNIKENQIARNMQVTV